MYDGSKGRHGLVGYERIKPFWAFVHNFRRSASVSAVSDLNDHAAIRAEPVDLGVAVVPTALGHRLGLGGFDGLDAAVPGHGLLREVLHGVGDGRSVRVVRLGRDAHRFAVVVLAAAPRHGPVDGRRRRRRRPAAARVPTSVVLVAKRLVQLGRVVQQALHENLLLGVVAAAPVRPAAVAQLAGAGPAAGQRPVTVVGGHGGRQVLGAAAHAAHDVRAPQRRRRLLEPVQRASRSPGVQRPRVRLHVEALAAQQRRFGECPLRLGRREWHVDHAARVGGRPAKTSDAAAVVVFTGCVHLEQGNLWVYELSWDLSSIEIYLKLNYPLFALSFDDLKNHCSLFFNRQIKKNETIFYTFQSILGIIILYLIKFCEIA